MATRESSKKFGGSALPSGNYFIGEAFIGEDTLTIAGQAPRTYDTLEIAVFTIDANGQPVWHPNTLRLNGCWRKRNAADGSNPQASGSLFEGLLKSCTGLSFSQVRDFINTKLVGKQFSIAYTTYNSQGGGNGSVPTANIIAGTAVKPMTASPARLAAEQSATQQQGAPQGTTQGAPAGQQPPQTDFAF